MPETFQGKVFLIRQPLEKTGIYSDPLLGWEGVINDLYIEYVEGDHAQMVEDENVCKYIRKYINDLNK